MTRKRPFSTFMSRLGIPRASEPDETVSAEYADGLTRELAEAEEEARLKGGVQSREEHEREMDAFMEELRARSGRPRTR